MSQMNLFGGPDDPDNFDYRIRFFEAIRKYPRSHLLTADDPVKVVGLPPGDHNQLGRLMREAGDMGLIELTDQYTTSTRPDRHGGIQRVWRKL